MPVQKLQWNELSKELQTTLGEASVFKQVRRNEGEIAYNLFIQGSFLINNLPYSQYQNDQPSSFRDFISDQLEIDFIFFLNIHVAHFSRVKNTINSLLAKDENFKVNVKINYKREGEFICAEAVFNVSGVKDNNNGEIKFTAKATEDCEKMRFESIEVSSENTSVVSTIVSSFTKSSVARAGNENATSIYSEEYFSQPTSISGKLLGRNSNTVGTVDNTSTHQNLENYSQQEIVSYS